MNLRDGYCNLKNGECWLENVHIARYSSSGAYFNHEERRPRRLLLHKREIMKMESAVQEKGLTVVPLQAYFNEDNRLKLQVALARGKKLTDKRETIQKRDQERELRRQLKVF